MHGFTCVGKVRAWVKGLQAETLRVTILHREKVCEELMIGREALIETSLARETTFTFVLVNETTLL